MKIDSFDNVRKWSYALAKKWVARNLVPLGISSARKFETYKRHGNSLPRFFPKRPDDYFKKQESWKGWNDFFSKGIEKTDFDYYDYIVASEICRKRGIRNSIEYRNWKNKPQRLPSRPDQFYKDNWTGWQRFLGDSYSVENRQFYSKLKESDVRIIRHQLNLGVSGAILARSFGVSEMQISRIRKGINWSKV